MQLSVYSLSPVDLCVFWIFSCWGSLASKSTLLLKFLEDLPKGKWDVNFSDVMINLQLPKVENTKLLFPNNYYPYNGVQVHRWISRYMYMWPDSTFVVQGLNQFPALLKFLLASGCIQRCGPIHSEASQRNPTKKTTRWHMGRHRQWFSYIPKLETGPPFLCGHPWHMKV